MSVTIQPDYEQTLIQIARVLPPTQVAQLVDFARFLEAQLLSEALFSGDSTAEIEADNAEWDALLATDEAQNLLGKLADEALKDSYEKRSESPFVAHQTHPD